MIGHAKDEHRDYEILEKDYVALGGKENDILEGERNLAPRHYMRFCTIARRCLIQ